MEPNKDLAIGFETEICSRCGGSGKYSYCQMYGDTCFKCKGRTVVYTKRAEAAIAYARQLHTVAADQVQAGWLVYVEPSPMGGSKYGWLTVTETLHEDTSKWGKKQDDGSIVWMPYYELSHSDGAVCICNTTDPVRAVPTKDRLREIKAEAIAYQQTLTKTGTAAKRKAA